MSERQACETCRFFQWGPHECRRHAPGYKVVESLRDIREHVPVWPRVQHWSDWCGDYQRAADR
jgi:hypothetical protein